MAFNLTQLETFRRLALEQNFSRTAEALALTQPAVTQHVRALQEHFAVKLVEVIGRRTTLTDAGRFLASRADDVLGNVAALQREMREFADVDAGELRIGSSVTIGTYCLPAIVARFRKRYPNVATLIDVANTETVAGLLRSGRVSLALVEGPLSGDEYDIASFANDELILIAPCGHAFAKRRKPIDFADLAPLPLISRERGSGTRAQIEQVFEHAGFAPNVALTLPSGEAIVRAVELEIGVALISRLAATDAIRAGRIVEVALRGISFARTLRLVRLRGRTQSPAATAFASVLLDNAPK